MTITNRLLVRLLIVSVKQFYFVLRYYNWFLGIEPDYEKKKFYFCKSNG